MNPIQTKTTLVVGASTNPERYSYKAIIQLLHHGHQVMAFGIRSGNVDGIEIETEFPKDEQIDTVTMYVGAKNQDQLYEKIIALHPRRVLFNPGTENEEFYQLLQKNEIAYQEACTLVLLSIGDY